MGWYIEFFDGAFLIITAKLVDCFLNLNLRQIGPKVFRKRFCSYPQKAMRKKYLKNSMHA
jgi:hypothetical protein